VFSTSREDKQTIAQSRRLRRLPWPGTGPSGPVPQRPTDRLQHLCWTDPNMHRAQVERALKECEWKRGDVLSSPRGREHFVEPVTFLPERSRKKRPGSPRIDDREVPRLKLPGQNWLWARMDRSPSTRQQRCSSVASPARSRSVCASRSHSTDRGDTSCDPRRCPPLIASRATPRHSPILPARRARRVLGQRSSGPSPGRGPPRRSDVDFLAFSWKEVCLSL
jgi:hypothetical protein